MGEGVGNIVVPSVVFQAWGLESPVHYVVYDASGKSIVIEYFDGKLHIFDNPLGVVTNSPSFDWHMTNLRNYVNFSLDNVPPVKLGSGVMLQPLGQGTGMLGLPVTSRRPRVSCARLRSAYRCCRRRPAMTRCWNWFHVF